MRELGIREIAAAAIATVAIILALAILAIPPFQPSPITPPPPANQSAYGTVSGTILWEYGDIASNFRCVGTYPCAGCTVRFFKGGALVVEAQTRGTVIGKGLGCPLYAVGAGAFSVQLPAGDYAVSASYPDTNVGEKTTNITVRAGATSYVNMTLPWVGPV